MTSASSEPSAVQQEFWIRLQAEWLPAYCNDPKRRYSVEGFTGRSSSVSSADARDFLRAIDQKVVTVGEGGRIRMPQSKAFEVIFWEHSTKIVPRPITLWIEPVITIAAVARLHLDYGWPVNCLGMQSKDSAFDLMAFTPSSSTSEYIAGEIKPAVSQLNTLLSNLQRCSANEHEASCTSGVRRNAHRKWVALQGRHPPLFWALGPGGESRVFKADYDSLDNITFTPVDEECLRCPVP